MISKKPALLKKFKTWKSKDFRHFFLFIFPLIFQEFENTQLGQIIFSLRDAIYCLIQKDVSDTEIGYADQNMRKFLVDFSNGFGEHFMTPNFHDLEHLADSVKRSGPLYEFSGFNFEHVNGLLKNLAHGNRRIDKQIVKQMTQFTSNIIESQSQHPDVLAFSKTICSKKSWKRKEKIGDDLFICGKKTPISFDNSNQFDVFYAVDRMILDNWKLSTLSYDKGKSFISSVFINQENLKCIEIKKLFVGLNSQGKEGFYVANCSSMAQIQPGIFMKIPQEAEEVTRSLRAFKSQWNPASNYKNFVFVSPHGEYY